MAPTGFVASSLLQIDLSPVAANVSLNPTSSPQNFQSQIDWIFGAAAIRSVNEVYCAVRTLAASANETLDLTGSLLGLFGETLTFARISMVCISLLSTTNAVSITVGGAAANAWLGPLSAGTYTIYNGDSWYGSRSDATGWIVDGTHDQLKVTNNSGVVDASYFILLFGATS